MFDLNKAIAAWRRTLTYNRAFIGDDLDELERHVRDQVEGLQAEGLTEQAAFRAAMGEMGRFDRLDTEFRKVYWGKLRRRREVFNELIWSLSMLKNYLKVAFRTLRKQKLYALLNIVGLAIGLACFVLIARYVQYELSYDTFHEKADRIHRIVQQATFVYMGNEHWAVTAPPVAPALVNEFPEVTHATTLKGKQALLGYGDDHFYEAGLEADEHLFSVFSFALLRGDPATALAQPHAIVLTTSLAEKIFGDDDPMGKTLFLEKQQAYTVTGVVEDVPANAHFTFRFVTSIVSNAHYVRGLDENRWSWWVYYTYFVLQDGVPAAQLQAKMEAFTDKYMAEDAPENRERYIVQPLTAIHLESEANGEISANNDLRYIYLFSGIALAILLLACVNYMNLAIARSVGRAREVGMRKVVGARRRQLVAQFMGESVLLSLLALVLAVGLVGAIEPFFSQFVDRDLSLDLRQGGGVLLALLGLTVGVGLVSGSYPALFMSSLKPTEVLKGTGDGGSRRQRLRKVLIVGQYAVSMVLVVGSLITYEQLRFVQNKEMGYTREHIVTMRVRDEAVGQNYETIKAELLRHPNTLGVTSSSHLPTAMRFRSNITGWQGSAAEDDLPIFITSVGYDFLDVFDIELVEGRSFSRDFATDTTGVYLLNETAVQALGWQTGLGKQLHFEAGDGPVIGVMKDFHLQSLHRPIAPLLIYLDPEKVQYVSIKIASEDIPETLAFIEQTVGTFTPYPFAHRFLSEVFAQLYETERKLGQLFGFFTLLALVIASMGLFGLAAYTAEQRTKEVGVRKALGASVPNLVMLLSKEFTRLVVVAFVVAVPVAYLLMNRWLEAFAYRVEIGPMVFVVALLSVLLIAWLSVSYQALRAARVNPVQSLRYE